MYRLIGCGLLVASSYWMGALGFGTTGLPQGTAVLLFIVGVLALSYDAREEV